MSCCPSRWNAIGSISELPTPGERTYCARQTSNMSPAIDLPAGEGAFRAASRPPSRTSRRAVDGGPQLQDLGGVVLGDRGLAPIRDREQRPAAAVEQGDADPGAVGARERLAGASRRDETSGGFADSPWISAASEWNSNRTKSSFSRAESGSDRRNEFASNGIGRSVGISTSFRERIAASVFWRRLSPTFPLISAACSSRAGRLPYWEIHFFAVTCPTPGTPGHVVDAVAHQREHVGDLARPHSEERLDAGLVEEDLLSGVEHAHVRADELEHVLVGGHDDDLVSGLRAARGEGADHVVRLVAGQLEDRDAVGVEDLTTSPIWDARSSAIATRLALYWA
jgi:hypothetical protein